MLFFYEKYFLFIFKIMRNNYFYIFFISLFFVSCTYWQDFNAYFNLYYNASEIYEKTEKDIFNQQKDVFDFIEPNPSGSVNSNLVKVIEKCSKILQNYPSSNITPKAILLTGKALYYQTSFVRAKRKFNEYLYQKIERDDSLYAVYWLARTDLRLGNYIEGIAKYNLLLENKELSNRLKAEIFYDLIKYYKYRNEKSNLIISLNQFIEVSDNDKLLSNAIFYLCKIYYDGQEYDKVINLLSRIDNYNPTVELAFHSKILIIKALYNTNRQLQALEQLIKLRKNVLYTQYYSEIDIEIANTKLALKDYKAAFSQYKAIDTLYKNTPSAGLANFQIAKLYEGTFLNLDSAFIYFEKSSKMILPKELLDTVSYKLGMYTKYSTYRKNIKELYNILAIKDTISQLERICDTTSQQYNKSDTASHKLAKSKIQSLSNNLLVIKYKNANEDSLYNLIGENYFELSQIFENDLKILDSAVYYRNIVKDRFKSSRVYPINLYMLGLNAEKQNKKDEADSLYLFIYRNYPKTQIANAAAKKLGINEYIIDKDSAAYYYENVLNDDSYKKIEAYKKIVKNYPKSIYAVKSLISVGWIYENELNKKDSAYVYYKSAIMKNENLVPQRVKNKVDMYDKFLSKSTTDTVALALGNVKVPKTQITQVESNEKTETKNETDEITKMQFEMNKFDIRTTLERRKKRTIW